MNDLDDFMRMDREEFDWQNRTDEAPNLWWVMLQEIKSLRFRVDELEREKNQ